MGIIAIPRMTTPWKTVVVSMAVLGFLYGYVGTAGSAVWSCASVGQCLQYTVDQGFPGFFHSAALIPAAIWALLFAAVVYLLFLGVYGIRKAFPWRPALRNAQPEFVESVSSPAATAVESNTPASANAQSTAVREKKGWARPTPLQIAVGVALAWGILSVGPSRFAGDLLWVVPHHDVYAPDPAFACDKPPVPEYLPYAYGGWVGPNGTDGQCDVTWGGDAGYLQSDIVRGGENGLLAFLAIGAGLLLWPRLRAGMQESSPSRAAVRAPTLDLGTSDQPAVGPGETVGDKLRQLAALRDDGIISSEEFEAKKAEMLRAF
jgi:hypothetical protein